MLSTDQQQLFQQLLEKTSKPQQIWITGYLQGLLGGVTTNLPITPQANKPEINIYYATETGNTKALSLALMKAMKSAGFKVKNASVNRLKIKDIKTESIALFLCSTHGEGEPPQGSIGFFKAMEQVDGANLKGLNYAVLGLGDSSYESFCGAAINLDKQLQRLGANPLQDIKLLDVDYLNHTNFWIEKTVTQINKLTEPDSQASLALPIESTANPQSGKGYTRLEPITGTLRHSVNLNDIDSNKLTYHIEIETSEEITYHCGDAIGILVPDEKNQGDKTPRLYSISSSPSFHPGEIHLTVGLATYQNEDGSLGYGICSKYLADLQEGDPIQFYVAQNQLFNLPDDDKDIIMIGVGTGIAPFRSFVYERFERNATGRNWLFFGDQQAHCDFLYQSEWQEHLATGALEEISLAFSRDQADKIYVQQRLNENAEQLIQWIDQGACLYLCGSKDPMSKEVDATLVAIIAKYKFLSKEAAQDLLAEMEEKGRYLKDVY